MTSNTKVLKQTIELLTGELKQVGEYRDNAVRCGVELNKQLAAMTAHRNELKTALRKIAALDYRYAATNGCAYAAHALAHQALVNAEPRAEAVKEGGME
jgi:hypothetical protein